MHVSIAIVAFRNPDDIVRCLKALERSTYQDFEVVICENGGRAAHAALCAAVSPLKGGQQVKIVLARENLGYAGGVNTCLSESPAADAWWVLNPDTEPYPQALAAQISRLARGDCDAVGCTLHLPNGKVQSFGGHWQSWLARAVSIGHSGELDQAPDPAAIERRQNYLNGASMVIGRKFLEATGPMKEDYFLYCEEVEWCLRAQSRGMRLGFAPKALVLHHQGTTTGNTTDFSKRSRMPVYLGERNKLLLTRDLFPLRLPVAALFALAMLLQRYPRRGAWRQLSYAINGWCAGIRGERGKPEWLEV